jgi:hypothetical protein
VDNGEAEAGSDVPGHGRDLRPEAVVIGFTAALIQAADDDHLPLQIAPGNHVEESVRPHPFLGLLYLGTLTLMAGDGVTPKEH